MTITIGQYSVLFPRGWWVAGWMVWGKRKEEKGRRKRWVYGIHILVPSMLHSELHGGQSRAAEEEIRRNMSLV